MVLKNDLLKEMIRRSNKTQERLLEDAYQKWSGEGTKGLKKHVKTIDRALNVNRTMEAAPDTPFNGIVIATSTTLSNGERPRIVARPALTTSEKLNSNEQDLKVIGAGSPNSPEGGLIDEAFARLLWVLGFQWSRDPVDSR